MPEHVREAIRQERGDDAGDDRTGAMVDQPIDPQIGAESHQHETQEHRQVVGNHRPPQRGDGNRRDRHRGKQLATRHVVAVRVGAVRIDIQGPMLIDQCVLDPPQLVDAEQIVTFVAGGHAGRIADQRRHHDRRQHAHQQEHGGVRSPGGRRSMAGGRKHSGSSW